MPTTIDLSVADLAAIRGVPHVDQYFGVWAMESMRFRGLAEHVNHLDLRGHIEARDGEVIEDAGTYRATEDGVAVVSIGGVMSKYGTSLTTSGSTIRARQAIRAAVADPDVRAIVIHIDSPGGMFAGTAELGVAVARASVAKPTVAYIEDLGASAAYWVASQAGKVYANRTASVGSIGTYCVVRDTSKAAEDAGVQIHVVKAGEFKGTGVPGVAVTDDTLAEVQRHVNDANAFFLEAVAEGRGMTAQQVEQLADGRVHTAADALALGLIDGVRSFDEILGALAPQTTRGAEMADNDNAPQAATLPELRAACPGADNDFLIAQLDGGATEVEASRAWMTEQNRRLEAAEVEKAEQAAKLAEAESQAAAADQHPGVDALGTENAGDAGGSAMSVSDRWEAAVEAYEARGLSAADAVAHAQADDPELHREYLREFNKSRGRICYV